MASAFFNEDHESIREMAQQFAEGTLAGIAAEIDKTNVFPEEVVQEMAELGFYGLKIPEEYGGLGLDMRSYVCVMEEVAKKCATATLFISSANSLSTPTQVPTPAPLRQRLSRTATATSSTA